MKDLTDAEIISALRLAYAGILDRKNKLLEIVKHVATKNFCICCGGECISCDAKKLLLELGEDE